MTVIIRKEANPVRSRGWKHEGWYFENGEW